METKRKALGRGLEQLFTNERIDFDKFESDIVNDTPKDQVIELNIADIRSNPHQPRKNFDEQALQELADSIKEHGLVQPIIVKKSIKGYELVAGERRTKASKLAGKTTIPAIVRDFDDTQMMEIALIENIQRENLNPIEEATAYQKILDVEQITQESLAQKFGKSRSYITNILGLLRLPEEVKDYVIKGKISMGHARVLSKLESEKEILNLSNKVISEGLSVRGLEQATKDVNIPRVNQIHREPSNLCHNIYERALQDKIGTKVKVTNKKIEIPFDSEKDLERILEIIGLEVEGD